jgi:UDP-N-acetylmuramyl pentapeptide phosphotransferase/UDP-N-acetylglucosamine-1-phosphate transferase
MYSGAFLLLYFFGVCSISYFSIISVRSFAITYKLQAKLKERDLHDKKVIKILGVTFVTTLIFCSLFYISYFDVTLYSSVVLGGLIITICGFRDDLTQLKPITKLALQIIALATLIVPNELQIENLYGFLGVHSVPELLQYPITFFTGIFMINSFNLIDGIDGNAGLNSLLIFSAFSLLFLGVDIVKMFGLCFVMACQMLVFLPMNIRKTNKILMGDSGSLFLGFMIFFFSIYFYKNHPNVLFSYISDPILVPLLPIALFTLPLLDSISVIIYRTSNRRMFYIPDNYHAHHVILFYTKSHFLATLYLNAIASIIFLIPFLFLNSIEPLSVFYLYFSLLLMGLLAIGILRKKMIRKIELDKINQITQNAI